MTRRLLAHAQANAIAYLALFIALGGVGYAAGNPLRDKAGSVDSRHIENNAVRARHLDSRLGVRQANPPGPGKYTGDWSGGQLKIVYEDGQQIEQVIYLQFSPPCRGIFFGPQVTTTGNEQYLTATNPQGQMLQLHIAFDDQSTVEILQGAVTQSAEPTSCGVPAGLDVEL